ncbi:MAG: mevalonate kinase, partial [Saprospiraceae bacterium]
MNRDLTSGRRLHSNIPEGYGMGSSGAVCVAVLSDYASPATLDRINRPFLARMESFFHGTSSGTDPYIISRRRP